MDSSKAADDDAVGRSAMTKVSWRILPLLGLGYLVAYMDRSNISFASLQMNTDLKFSAAVYGLGAGIFFVGYALFEVPSNLLLVRFGARRWIARIMLTWGLISTGMMFVQTPMQFYVMRFLLGVAEAGFFPGVMFYLSTWYPNAWRARAVSRFYVASPIANIVMGALAGSLLGLNGRFGLAGWQWLFLAEGVPSIAMAAALLFFLPEAPERAAWLSAPQKAWITRNLAADLATSGGVDHGFLKALTDPLVLGVGLATGLAFACSNAVSFSAPKLLVEATGWSVGHVGYLTALGGTLGAAAMLLVGWHSDRRAERHLHFAGTITVAACAIAVMSLMAGAGVTVAAYLTYAAFSICIGMVGVCIVGDAVHPGSRAVSFAAINTIAQVGAFFGPMLWGIAADRTGGFQFGLRVAPLVMAVAVVIVLVLRRRGAKKLGGPVAA